MESLLSQPTTRTATTAGTSDRSRKKASWDLRSLCWCFIEHLGWFAMLFSVSAVAWSMGNLFLLPLTLLFPLALELARTRWLAVSMAAGYFAGALSPMIPGAHVFFGKSVDLPAVVALYVLWVLILGLPFWLVGACGQKDRWAVAVVVILIEAALPIGLPRLY